jgi:hypothetical protein
LGGVVVLAAVYLEYRRGVKFEFWVTMSALLLALIIMPLYTLLSSANGVDTGYHLALYRLSGSYFILGSDYTQPVLSTAEQFGLALMSTLAGILIGPALDRAARTWKTRQ